MYFDNAFVDLLFPCPFLRRIKITFEFPIFNFLILLQFVNIILPKATYGIQKCITMKSHLVLKHYEA